MPERRAKYGAIPSDSEASGSTSVRITDEQISPLMLRVNKTNNTLKPWEFPGWGNNARATPDERELADIDAHLSKDHTKLSEWLATAICGNDILSSCLYVSGIVASKAGFLAPLALAVVAGVLYLYRFIYGEVVNAIPLNGGSYNVLLNTTTKRVASVAASLAILSYIATGVVSGTSACNYLASQIPSLPIVPATIGLLFFFAVLSLIGITESALVALAIFIAHSITLAVLCVFSAIFVFNNGFEILKANFSTDFPDINLAGDTVTGNLFTAVFFGTSTAMLGISGFESSSQFVEEQADGVFPKTLRVRTLSFVMACFLLVDVRVSDRLGVLVIAFYDCRTCGGVWRSSTRSFRCSRSVCCRSLAQIASLPTRTRCSRRWASLSRASTCRRWSRSTRSLCSRAPC